MGNMYYENVENHLFRILILCVFIEVNWILVQTRDRISFVFFF